MKFNRKTVKASGESFTIQELSARQRKEVLKLHNDKNTDLIDLQAQYLKLGVVEFKDKDLEEILDLPGTVFNELFEVVTEISGLSTKDDEEIKN